MPAARDPSRPWAVCVYCASGPEHPELLELAAELGEAIAERGWTLVWGGGRVSAMGALATAARARGGRTVGVIPQILMRREIADAEADELIVSDTMHERKQLMEDRADAFIVLPGGVGTLDELFDAWTTGYLGLHGKPIVMLDPFGHYEGLWLWLNGLLDSGYISQAAMDRLMLVDKVGAALEACAPA
ncbi:TIGR00730 family Rossman fold protein [Mycobacterium palustre]|uniref:Cytokinin riboside 5'-monophosphate phosphoribohydrolase n=1 Tax=Mycobacterium palustre TaxID=153971 RepID=A0A1X2A0Y6_9MYCO|nr:TIGR00730 family Rossman fold protein [Mycobacterium palustre]MCV7100945.1 TIGR00730 family Rossman fold protein [Mycobacterium palustre]ORW34582.1 decarboxylase [Mycobacterium palustre]